MLLPASVGALIAGALVIAVGVALRQPLARVPESTLKFAVGVMLSAFGVFWIGEGLGFPWPGEDLALVGLVTGFLAASALGVAGVKRSATRGKGFESLFEEGRAHIRGQWSRRCWLARGETKYGRGISSAHILTPEHHLRLSRACRRLALCDETGT